MKTSMSFAWACAVGWVCVDVVRYFLRGQFSETDFASSFGVVFFLATLHCILYLKSWFNEWASEADDE